jgi:membrane-associated HD superfamily phosphohydrolase
MNDKSFVHFVICTIVFVVFVLFFFPTQDIAQKSELPVLGQSSPRSISAQISFEVPKNAQELEEEIKKTKERVYPVFKYDEDSTKKLLENFELLMSQIENYSLLQKEISDTAMIDQEKITAASNLYRILDRKISETALKQLCQNPAARDTLKRIFRLMVSQGISNVLIAERSKEVTNFEESHNRSSVKYILYSKGEVTLIKDNKDTTVESSYIRPKEFLIDSVLDKYKKIFSLNSGISSAFFEILYIFVSPNIFYLETETERRQTEAAELVNPSKGMVPRGTEIISQGSIVTRETLEKLEAMQNVLQKDSSKFLYTAFYGQYILLLTIILTLCIYLWRFRPIKNIRLLHIWAVAMIAIAQVGLFRFVHDFFLTFIQNEYLNPIWFYPFAFAPVLAAVLFTLRTSIALAVWSSVLFGIFAGYDLSFCIVSFLVSFAMSLVVYRIRYRVKFI